MWLAPRVLVGEIPRAWLPRLWGCLAGGRGGVGTASLAAGRAGLGLGGARHGRWVFPGLLTSATSAERRLHCSFRRVCAQEGDAMVF